MTDWIAKQKDCKRCRGWGYVQSEMRHEDGSGRAAWSALCQYCQPSTVPEWEEAAAQESKENPQ